MDSIVLTLYKKKYNPEGLQRLPPVAAHASNGSVLTEPTGG